MKEIKMPMSEKAVAIYDAIIAMINEGADVNEMKVGDITARAGIGKGTAYEYFQSKDEMVETALFYNVMCQIETAKALVNAAGDFHSKFRALLDYMESNRDQIRPFLWMMRLAGNSFDFLNATNPATDCGEMQQCITYLVGLADWFIAFGDEEGLFQETNHDFRVSALLSQIVQYGFYIHFGSEQNPDEVKEFIYEGFIKQLS